jgi:hypothetical protein
MSEMMFDRSLEYSMLLLGGLYGDITMSDFSKLPLTFKALMPKNIVSGTF